MCQKSPPTDTGVGKVPCAFRWAPARAADGAETLGCVCPSCSGSVVAAPAASPPPLSRLILVVGSIICLAARVPVSCLPRGFCRRREGSHQAEAAPTTTTTTAPPASAAAVFGDRQRCGADVRVWSRQKVYGCFQPRPCLLFHLFLGGRRRLSLDLTRS